MQKEAAKILCIGTIRRTHVLIPTQDYLELGAKPSCMNKAFIKIQLFSIQRTRIVSGLNYTEAHEHGQNPDHHQSRDNGQRWQHSISLIFICPITSCHSYANSIFEDTSFLHPTIRRSEAVRSTRMSSHTTSHRFTQRLVFYITANVFDIQIWPSRR